MSQKLPFPGVVMGVYPERKERRRAAHPLSRAALGWLTPFRRRSDWQMFGAEVGARQEILEPLPDDSFQLIVAVIHKLLRVQGFERGLLAESMACVCEAARRSLGVSPFETQIVAARLMLSNQLAEMATGEGKTLATAMAASIAAMAGIPVHCITANDYLVLRDTQLMAPLFHRLGVRVGTVTQADSAAARRNAYGQDITYCTAKELVFDYLRDLTLRGRSKHDLTHRVQLLDGTPSPAASWQQPLLRGLCMAIVDEADSVFIDEAQTPMVLAQARDASDGVAHLRQAIRIARNLHHDKHFRRRDDGMDLTDTTRDLLAALAKRLPDPWSDARVREELIQQALCALHLYERDRDYVVSQGKVLIVDQTTGRIAPGRAWSRGLHQFIEIKEGCELSERPDTLAQITYQRFFPRYIRLAGTSGTLREARAELKAYYQLRVQCVPLRKPCLRGDAGLRLFPDAQSKWCHVTQRVAELVATGRPVLIGTDSISASEQLSQALATQGIAHQVLNARQDQAEARIVAQAGNRGAVTVATNMAGRGTDIVLAPGVAESGGLHVICCQLNSDGRIDRQLQGRSARQGDPGSTETILSLEEPLIVRWIPALLVRALHGWAPRGRPLPRGLARSLVRLCQWLEQHARRGQRRALRRRDAIDARRLSLGGAQE